MKNRKIKILVIDDEPDNLFTLNVLIQDVFPGSTTITALNGNKGIELASLEDPDVILLDILMPGMDGFEVCRTLKANINLNDIPVVFVTALRDDKENRIKALEVGVEAFITKPIDIIELTAQVRAMVKIKTANIEKKNEKERLALLVEEQTRELKETNAVTLKLLEELKIENEARKKSEEKYRILFNSINDAIFIYRISPNGIPGNFIEVNDLACNRLGYTKNELLNLSFKNIGIPPANVNIESVIEKFISEKSLVVEWIHLTKDGKQLPVEISSKIFELEGSLTAISVVRDIQERKLVERKILQSLKEKETLIRELYHRTRNTLQVIDSMLVLQAIKHPTNDELQSIIKDTELRIQTISLVHQMLYKAQDLSHISVKEYIEELSGLILENFENSKSKIIFNFKIDEQYFLLDTAIPLGLILNELMTNSLKHAFLKDKNGVILITLSKSSSGKIILNYSDDGIGVPDGFDFRTQNTFGLKLIYNIGEKQMLGTIEMENNNGLHCIFEFPDNLYKERI